MSEAKCETGWGDLSTRALLDGERPSPRPAARYARVDPPPPGEGENNYPLAAPALAKRRRMRIERPSQTSR